jgi:predicted DNA-binding transcriptional regulator AlpA
MFLTDKQLGGRWGVTRQTIWKWLRDDPSFPRPTQLSAGTTRWRLDEVEVWEVSRRGRPARPIR